MNKAIIQSLIYYIEKNLDKNLSQNALAIKTGYSKYYLQRAFKTEIGMSPSEYVRLRRMALSAALLLHSDIDIAFLFQFNSQEAFSRSFKDLYHLSPGKYRKLMKNIRFTQEEFKMTQDTEIKGWILSGTDPLNYEIGIDEKEFHQGRKSGFIRSISHSTKDQFGTLMQMFKADKYKGKRLKFSCFLKSNNADDGCGIWMRVDDAFGDILQFDNMENRMIMGSTEWNHYSIVLDVPENSSSINFGVLLAGNGQVFADGLTFTEVDESMPTTNINHGELMNDAPVNLSFEE